MAYSTNGSIGTTAYIGTGSVEYAPRVYGSGGDELQVGDTVIALCNKGQPYYETCNGWTGEIIRITSNGSLELMQGSFGSSYLVLPHFFSKYDPRSLYATLNYDLKPSSINTSYRGGTWGSHASTTDPMERMRFTVTGEIKTKPTLMKNVLEFFKNMTASAEEKLLQEYGVEDPIGTPTSRGMELALQIMYKANRAEVIKVVQAMKDEDKKDL